MDAEHFRDELHTRAGIVGAFAPVIAILVGLAGVEPSKALKALEEIPCYRLHFVRAPLTVLGR